MDKYIPTFDGNLRKHLIIAPPEINEVSGIRIFGKLIKSILFSTDISIIKNTNCDAIIAVYPFTPQPVITHSILMAADRPVFCGVGGGTTTGKRVINLALDAEFQGAIGVVLNSPTKNDIIEQVKQKVDIPVVVTVIGNNDDVEGRLFAGADILNVSAAADTPQVVAKLRERYPKVAIMATGGPTAQTIKATVNAGANAITYTPPTSGQIFKELMQKYRM